MATDLRLLGPSYPERPKNKTVDVTCSATPNTLMEVQLPANCYELIITLYAEATAAYFCDEGTDNALVGTNVKNPLQADTYIQLDPIRPDKNGNASIFIGSATASQVVKVRLAFRYRA